MEKQSSEDLPSQGRFDLSEGCPGRRYLRTGQERQQAHSEACRRSIESLLKGDSSGSARGLTSSSQCQSSSLVDVSQQQSPSLTADRL